MDKEQKNEDEPIRLLPEMGSKKEHTWMAKISGELVMILLIGFLFGIAIKIEASKRVNVTDKTFYGVQDFNFTEMENRLTEKNQAQAQNQEQGSVENVGACSQP